MDGPLPYLPDVVALAGDLDISTLPAVLAALQVALTSDTTHGRAETVVDLRAVRHLDAGTIRLLLDARQATVDAGRRFRVTGVPPTVRPVLEASGAGRQLLDRSEPAGALVRVEPAPYRTSPLGTPDDRIRSSPRFQQDTIDTEVRISRRLLLTRLRPRLRLDPRALTDVAFLAVADTGTLLDAVALAAGLVADAVDLHLDDPGTGALRLARRQGLTDGDDDDLARIEISGSTPHGSAAVTGLPVIVDDVTDGTVPAWGPALGALRDAGVRALHVHPLHDRDGRLLGVLSFQYVSLRHPVLQHLLLQRRSPYLSPAPRRGTPELVARCAAHALSAAGRQPFDRPS